MCTFDDAGDRDSENHRQFCSQSDSKLAKWKPWVRRRLNKFRWEKMTMTRIFSTKTLFFMTLQKKHNALPLLICHFFASCFSFPFLCEELQERDVAFLYGLFEPQACRTQRLKAVCRFFSFPFLKAPLKQIYWSGVLPYSENFVGSSDNISVRKDHWESSLLKFDGATLGPHGASLTYRDYRYEKTYS